MAEDSGNEDQWLYGDSNPEPPEETPEENKFLNDDQDDNSKSELPQEASMQISTSEELPTFDESATLTESKEENGETAENEDDEDDKMDSEDDDSDDDVNVVIGDIKTNPGYPSLNIKRGNLIQTTSIGDKSKQQSGKFSIDEFESIGTINGIPAQEFNLDSLEDKPWRKPGADITDYFNYGFNEDTWRAYCERQKRMRVHESGAGLLPMNPGGLIRSATSITNDNSKYSGNYTGPRKAGPPPGRRMMGSIDVIGGNSGLASRRVIETVKTATPKENVIQVMTADRREYSRKPPNFPDVTVPPPGSNTPFEAPVTSFTGNYSGEFYNAEPDPYYQSYEPTQEQQWGNDPAWAPSDIKQLTPGPGVISSANPLTRGAPSSGLAPPGMPPDLGPATMVPPPSMSGPPPKSGSPMVDTHSQDSFKTRESKDESPVRERDRDSRGRSVKNDRHRERSHRRDRSRSRSRRHKSRSRSPSHRSQHKKKKTKRHDKSDSD